MMRAVAELSRSDIVDRHRIHIWPPFTSSEDHERRDPLVIASAKGAWLTDVDGNAYIDANGSWWVNTLGHGHPRLLRALTNQAQTLMHCSLAGVTHEPAALLAEELVRVAPPGMTRVFFSDDGSTAVEVAVKIAFQYWQQNGRPRRTRFLTLAGAYHGDTLGAVSVGGIDTFRSTFGPLLFDAWRAPSDDDTGSWERVIESMITTLRREADSIAGVIVEPILQGVAGMRLWPASCLAALRRVTQEVDTWLIADEVFTGYGRTGTMWACEHADVTPDLLCTAKGFTAGVLPMAATLATSRVYDGFRGDGGRALMHGHSFCGNPLGAAVAREVLSIYREDHVLEQVRYKAPIIERAFQRIGEMPGVFAVRSIGMVAAADLGNQGYRGSIGWKVYEAARARGAYLRPLGDTVYIAPPFTIDEPDLARLLDVVQEATAEALKPFA